MPDRAHKKRSTRRTRKPKGPSAQAKAAERKAVDLNAARRMVETVAEVEEGRNDPGESAFP